ncbi:15880_t:CDS:1, partial [Gigaspora margarita]
IDCNDKEVWLDRKRSETKQSKIFKVGGVGIVRGCLIAVERPILFMCAA